MGRAKARIRRSKAKSSGKKDHKKIQLPKVKANESSDKKTYKKLPGFDAFNVQAPVNHSLLLLNILISLRVKLHHDERRKAVRWWSVE
jgi:hypothetical protein